MDGLGTIVFLILAAIISGISNKAQKKAKEEAAQRKKQPPQPIPEPDFGEMLKKLMGEQENVPEFEPEMVTTDIQEEVKKETTEHTPTYNSEEGTILQNDFETPTELVTDEMLYPKMEFVPIDIKENADSYNYNEIENPIDSINNLIGTDNTKPMNENTITDSEIQSTEQNKSVVDDFDPVKAIIYSEIITPKYI